MLTHTIVKYLLTQNYYYDDKKKYIISDYFKAVSFL